MITIKRIEIKGFFGKGDFVWNLDPVVNILGGKNGSGKSTIFKFCYDILNNEEMDSTTFKELKKIIGETIITFSNGWILIWNSNSNSSSLVFQEGGKLLTTEKASVVKDDQGTVRQFAELQKMVKVFIINSFEQHLEKAIQYEHQPTSLTLNNPMLLDLMIKDQIDKRNRDFSETMEAFMDSPTDDTVARKQFESIYKKIYSSLSHFMQEYDQPFKSSFEFAKNSQIIKFDQLSMGEKQILLLLLMVANTKQVPCIFFMDEPDLSMHIDWKEKLVKELHELNPNMQIILSTHAPSVITGWHDKVKEVNQLIK